MRITNKMMTNNALYNINNNKNRLDMLENQYSTGKKITRPSDDPVIAVRALKFRTNLTEIEQYTGKNIPDALNWMEVTEAALDTINGLISNMNTYCNQAANDYETASDRNAIVENLQQYVQQIYQEGNTNYAGRYVFSGYKTDTSLVFKEDTSQYSYRIYERNRSGSEIESIPVIRQGIDLRDMDANSNTFETDWNTKYPNQPSLEEVYRLPLGYDALDANAPIPVLRFTDKDGKTYSTDGLNADLTSADNTINMTQKLSTEEGAYFVGDDEVTYLSDTGELILGKNIYSKMVKSEDIGVDYTKSSFGQNDLRPEHYYDCFRTEYDEEDNVVGTVRFDKEDQPMKYEVNFNQKLIINTQGRDAFTTRLSRMVTEIADTVKAVNEVEDNMKQIDEMLNSSNYSDDQKAQFKLIREQLQSEYTLRTNIMTKAFQRGLTITEEEQESTNVAVSDLGGRYKRLLLTQSRLEDQAVDFEELLSNNEDCDLVDTVVKYSSAQTVYNASLSAASKLVQNSLLDFIR